MLDMSFGIQGMLNWVYFLTIILNIGFLLGFNRHSEDAFVGIFAIAIINVILFALGCTMVLGRLLL